MAQPRSFKFFLILVIALLVVLALAIWLSLRHQTPTFTIVDFEVPTWVDKSHHGPDIIFTLVIKNPNKVYSIIYNNTVLTAKYNQGTLGQMHKPEFKQGTKNKDYTESFHMEANVQVWETLVNAMLKPSEKPTLKVELVTGIRYNSLGHNSKEYDLRLHGRFEVGSDGKILGKKKKVKLCKSDKGSC